MCNCKLLCLIEFVTLRKRLKNLLYTSSFIKPSSQEIQLFHLESSIPTVIFKRLFLTYSLIFGYYFYIFFKNTNELIDVCNVCINV